ncbi:hypothetical protein [Actinacidiphila rubida]|uniref:hypothetical protein n=1 Tax=Actinacidiphila rubida TaxID=310780 RepID=UPI00114CC4B1|nr:hypothetical protein [Actinacidiphila rubida]
MLANVRTPSGGPARQVTVDQDTAADSDLQWAYVLHARGVNDPIALLRKADADLTGRTVVSDARS